MLFQSYFDGEQKLVTQSLLKNAPQDESDISSPGAANFSYGIWIYVKQWEAPGGITGTEKEEQSRIFTRADELGLYLTSDATLKVRFADIGVRNVLNEDTDIELEPVNYTERTLTGNFPIQKWVHVGLVADGDKFDGYINGKLVKSIELKGTTGITPKSTDGKAEYPLKFGRGNIMKDELMIAEHKRRIYAMDPKGMWDLYMDGNGANGLTKVVGDMNVNLSIMKNGVESTNVSVW